MSCKHCDAGLVRTESTSDPGVMIHITPVDILACEDQPARHPTDALPDEEREKLFVVCDIAAEIRLDHDIPLFDAVDMVRRQMTIDPELEEASKEAIVRRILEQEGHTCTNKCTAEQT